MKAHSSPLSSNSPWFCCAPCPPPQFPLSLVSLRSYIDSLIFSSQIKTSVLLFLSSSFIVPLTWMLTSKFDP